MDVKCRLIFLRCVKNSIWKIRRKNSSRFMLEHTIKMGVRVVWFEHVDWINLAQDWVLWRAVLNK